MTATTTFTALAKAKLKAKVAKKVVQGAKTAVTLKKLAPREKVKVLVDGKVVAKGKANAKEYGKALQGLDALDKEGLTLAQIMPGPLAAQLAIYLGYVHYGVLLSPR